MTARKLETNDVFAVLLLLTLVLFQFRAELAFKWLSTVEQGSVYLTDQPSPYPKILIEYWLTLWSQLKNWFHWTVENFQTIYMLQTRSFAWELWIQLRSSLFCVRLKSINSIKNYCILLLHCLVVWHEKNKINSTRKKV